MKKHCILMPRFVLAIVISACLSSVAYAKKEGGSSIGGGGDMCERRIQNIRDDIQSWIFQGGPSSLTLPSGVTDKQYAVAMMFAIYKTRIRCVTEADPGFPVLVENTPKVCRFDVSAHGSQITCDYKKFMNGTSEDDQYVLIHHEYAGIADLEPPNADESTYVISNQVTKYLQEQVVKKMAIKQKRNILLPSRDIALFCVRSSLAKEGCGDHEDAKIAFGQGLDELSSGDWTRIADQIRVCMTNHGATVGDLATVFSVLISERKTATYKELAEILGNLSE